MFEYIHNKKAVDIYLVLWFAGEVDSGAGPEWSTEEGKLGRETSHE